MDQVVRALLIERLASLHHDIWSDWMGYIFKCGKFQDDGSLLIPTEKVKRWSGQMTTPYEELSEKEKESNRYIIKEFIIGE